VTQGQRFRGKQNNGPQHGNLVWKKKCPDCRAKVLIDLKKHGARLQDFWDGLVSESRRGEGGIPLEKVKADLVRHGRLRA